MDQNYELWLELIQLWDNDSSSEQEPALSLNDQAKYLAKKHPITITNLNVRRFDNETEQEINVEEDRTIVCFKDVIDLKKESSISIILRKFMSIWPNTVS